VEDMGSGSRVEEVVGCGGGGGAAGGRHSLGLGCGTWESYVIYMFFGLFSKKEVL
jgi:hypothetical protein